MSAKLRVGVVGVGYLGRIHAKIYAAMPEVELVGVVDTDPASAAAVAADYRCRAYGQAEELLGQVDAVSIVVPTVHHLNVARPFLEHGVHMLMEKPLAPSYDEARTLVALAEQAGVIFQVGHLERFNAGVMALAEHAADPRFIEVHRLGGFVERATDVDVVTDLMIHDIDIVLSLVKSDIREVSAMGLPVLTEHVDIANARLEFQNGAVANVTASRVSSKKERRLRIFARHAYYALNYIDQQIETVRALPPKTPGARPEMAHERLAIEPKQPLDAELQAFVHSVRTGAPPLVNGHTGLQALRVALLVKEKIAACQK
ncbi:MAG: oxidoreductase [Candidatus Muproteobacteria bacterium RBG_16_64_11]|uniref:Oxidoreductase n=1 Tax=Candidatus Muproteobacteria bacterium RBG_16_64_11 TaxID=1817758 RepID=A0A1F6TDY4_9PROT|nr:MAG: oxidoreductase [Candidatus Muproteobacteria bacterium RBG_16_64_11]